MAPLPPRCAGWTEFCQSPGDRASHACRDCSTQSARQALGLSVSELEAKEAAPVLKQYLLHVSGGVRSYFDATKNSPLEDFEREAARHPVFQITTVEKTQTYLDIYERDC